MESSHGGEKRTQNQLGGSGSLWSNQDEMRRYVSKLKSELAEQKSRVKRVHRDKAEEIKRLQENLDYEKQKAIENLSKKLESDKVYELKKMKESVVRQKENEHRQVLRVKDEEMRALKLELQENKNTTRILELENKRIISDQTRCELNDNEKRLKSEVSSLRNEKRRLEESLRIKSEADFEKAEVIRQMKQEHNSEIRRLTRESKRESLKEFRQLKAVSREVELKNHQLAVKEADLRRLEREKNHLGNELNLQRRGSLNKNNSFNSQKTRFLSASQNSESDVDSVVEDRIKKLKMRNSELVAIARKLEEKTKQLQEEKNLLEKSSEINNPELGNLKKAFVRQRAKDLTERAKLLMNKDNEINNLKKEVEETRHNGINENGCVEELDKIVHQSTKERLLLEKQVSLKVKSLEEEIKDFTLQNTRLTNDNNILKEHVSKLQDFESKYHTVVFEIKEIRDRNERLENACSEKDKRLYELALERQAFTAKNNALQQKNAELLTQLDHLNKVEQECSLLKGKVHILINEKQLMERDNERLRREIERFCEVTKVIERLKQENSELEDERKNVLLKLEEQNEQISSLHQAQGFAQRKHEEEVSGLKEALWRVNEQQAGNDEARKPSEIKELTSSVLTSTPRDNKYTQTSRPSSPIMSPIIHDEVLELHDGQPDVTRFTQDLLNVPYNGTSSSTSFDLEKAGTRIQELAVSDSDELDYNGAACLKSESLVSSCISEYLEETNVQKTTNEMDTSYSADISQASDVEEACVDDPRENPDFYIGSPLEDLEEKLSIFIAKYNYDPMLYSPNDNPEMELAFQAGDYLYVYGDIDEDGFYVGELMNGDRGLVPSNFVERIAEDEAILKESDGIDDDYESEERRHEWFRSSLDHVLTEQLDDIRESDEDNLGSSSLSEDENRKNRKDKRNKPEADQASSEALDSMDSDIPEPRVPPSPTKLSLDRQFTNSALISWRGAQLPSNEIQGYNIYVDGKLKMRVKGSKKTNAIVEDIEPTKTYRLSVRTKSVTGVESRDTEATMVFGPDAKFSPVNLCVTKITATSAEIQWLSAHSSYLHEVLVNESLECIKPGSSSYNINDLTPATIYQVQVRTLIPDHLKLNMEKITEDDLTAEIEFKTADGGLPEPPVDLRLAQRTSENILLTWLPVTLSQDGFSNGYRVSSYKIYVNDIFCTETVSACVDSIEISVKKLRNLGRRNDFSRMLFVVRTLSVLGESVDSNVVIVGWDDLQDLTDDKKCVEVDHSSKRDEIIEKTVIGDFLHDDKDSSGNVETVCTLLGNNVEHQEGEGKPSFLNHVINNDRCSGNLEYGSSSENSTLENDLPYSEPDAKSIGSEKGDNSLGTDKNDNLTNIKLVVDTDVMSTADAPATIVREPPIVTRYEDVETETDSTESKTQDSEEELIERFEHFEVSKKDEESKMSVFEQKKEKQADTLDHGFEDSDIKKNVGAEKRHNEPETTEQQESTKMHSQEVESLSNDASEHGNNKQDSGTEGEVSEKPSSVIVDQQSESETDSEGRHDKHFQVLIRNAVSERQSCTSSLNKELLQSESDTETTEYGPPLSVIDEVDEDNLTDTNNPQKISDNTTSDGEATLSNKQIKSLPTDSFKSSDPSMSHSGTTTSDDEGFRTEDDVLELLDDDEGTLGDLQGDEWNSKRSDDQPGDTSRVNKCDNRTSPSGGNEDSNGQEGEIFEQRDDVRIVGDSVVVQNETDSNSEGISDSPNGSGTLNFNIPGGSSDNGSLTLTDIASCNTEESKKYTSSSQTTDDESTGHLSESSCPTRTSLKSDSTFSEDPPGAEHALETIIATLSLPSNRETTSGESDHCGNMDGGSKGTSMLISERYRSGSEVSENVSEPVRYFIAVYSYDPSSMSPNVDGADEELPFNEGDVIKVFGEKDDDGFFWGECKQNHGFVPSNMIAEMNTNEAEDLFKQADSNMTLYNELNSNGHMNGELDVDVISDSLDHKENGASDRLSFWENLEGDQLGPRKMKALYDYDPLIQSPNVDNEVELQFQAGEVIYVFGEMDEDGFFKGEHNGIRGLVPSNFLQLSHDNEPISDSSTNTALSTDFAQKQQSSLHTPNSVKHGLREENELQQKKKKKKNIFSKGKKMFKKAFK